MISLNPQTFPFRKVERILCYIKKCSYQLYQEGSSQLDGQKRPSRHQSGHAIDFVAYDENSKVTWDFKYYEAISKAFKQAARELEVSIIWACDWESLRDAPHVELNRLVAVR